MRIGFYSTVGNGWAFGEIASYNMPYCPQCKAFHYDKADCLSIEQKEAMADKALESLTKIEKSGMLDIKRLFFEEVYGHRRV